MTIPTDYISGTITLTNGSSSFTGNGTAWLAADFREGDLIIWVEGGEDFSSPIIQEILTNTTGTLTNSWAGPTVTNVPYRMRYQWDSSRVSAQARQLIEQLGNGNITSFSTLEGPGVPVFNGPHALTIKPETDFVNGVRYDVQVDLLADRDAYDGQSQGFSVLVSNIGDGRAAVYSKVSNAAGDWTNPAYVTGPLGASPTIEATVEMLTPGSDPIVNTNPITGGYSLDFELPAAEGFYWNSAYDSGISYNQSDVVRYNGSSFIAIQNVPSGQAPSNVFPPVDNAYWEILATRGVNGTGTVTELIEGGGIEIDSSDPENPIISLKLFEGDTGSGGALGGVPAPAAGDAANNKFLSANGNWEEIPINTPPRGYLFGLTLSNNVTDSNNDIDISVGEASSSNNTPVLIKLLSGITKRIDAVWSEGSGNGGLDTGVVANATYHVFIIYNPNTNTVDALFSTSVSSPTLPTGYTEFRRIGSIVRNGGAIRPFIQNGDEFRYLLSSGDVSAANPGTSAITRTLLVPTGLSLDVHVVIALSNSASTPAVSALVNALDETDTTVGFPGGGYSDLGPVANSLGYTATDMVHKTVRTNTSAQVRSKLSASASGTLFYILTKGYTDTRGRI